MFILQTAISLAFYFFAFPLVLYCCRMRFDFLLDALANSCVKCCQEKKILNKKITPTTLGCTLYRSDTTIKTLNAHGVETRKRKQISRLTTRFSHNRNKFAYEIILFFLVYEHKNMLNADNAKDVEKNKKHYDEVRICLRHHEQFKTCGHFFFVFILVAVVLENKLCSFSKARDIIWGQKLYWRSEEVLKKCALLLQIFLTFNVHEEFKYMISFFD